MKGYNDSMSQLVEALGKLPGIGRRSAERIIFHLLKTDASEVHELTRLIQSVKDETQFCKVCHFFSQKPTCHICSDPSRDQGIICVVEDPKDVIFIEKAGNYPGLYHVLLGTLSALEGVGPGDIQIDGLMKRIEAGGVREVILAMNPNTEGEMTSLYLTKIITQHGVKVSRIAHGVSVGSMLEYTDQATLARAIDGRVKATVS